MDSPTADAGSDGPSNLVDNPSFEEGLGGCGSGWTVSNSTLTRFPAARTGTWSCEVCPSASDATYFNLEATRAINVSAGSYYAEAWLLAPPDASAAGLTGVQVSLAPSDAGDFLGTQISPSSTWTPSAISVDVLVDGTALVYVHAYFPNGGCVLIDDVGLYRQ
jgi:hypothetical protein